MQNRNRMINKFALVLLSIVVLELVLIGDQVEPVKAIKKKIYLKKLKKLLPLLALVKPKKKIILVPIPIPMFKPGHQANPHYYQHHQHHQHHQYRPTDQMGPPMSFMMMGQDSSPNQADNGFVGVSMAGNGMLPMNMPPNGDPIDSFATMTATTPTPIIVNNIQPTAAPIQSTNSTANNSTSSTQAAMMLPTMTMIFQSEPGGNSAIELNMLGSNTANSTRAALLQRPPNSANEWVPWQEQEQRQQQQQQEDQFDEPSEQQSFGGEQYYSSPWTNRAPLASPAKVFRGERLRAQQQQQHQARSIVAPMSVRQQQAPSQQTSVLVGQVSSPNAASNQPQMPILLIKNRWRQNGNLNLPVAVLQHHQQQAVNQALEYEELVPIGPPQMMPVYQTPNGQIHMSPPPPVMIQAPALPRRVQQPEAVRPAQSLASSAQLEREEGGASGRVADLNSEVITTTNNAMPAEPIMESQRNVKPQSVVQDKTSNSKLASPAVKGKQQQRTSQKSASSGGY